MYYLHNNPIKEQHHYFYFTGEKTKAQRGWIGHPRSKLVTGKSTLQTHVAWLHSLWLHDILSKKSEPKWKLWGQKENNEVLTFQYNSYHSIIRTVLLLTWAYIRIQSIKSILIICMFSNPEWVLNTHLLSRFQMPESRNWVINLSICAMCLSECLALLVFTI